MLIKKYPNAGIYATAYQIQTTDGMLRWAQYKYIPNSPWEGLLPDYFKSMALGEYPVNTSVAVIPKKIFTEMGGFLKGYWFGEDADLFGKIALKYPIAFSWERGAIYHWDALGRACSRMPSLDYQEPFIKTARTALMKGEVPQHLTDSLNEYLWRIESQRAIDNLRAGNSGIAQDILKQCTTKWYRNEKMKWLLLAKLPSPLYLFIRNVKREFIKIVRKK
jgi:hypothetical protein